MSCIHLLLWMGKNGCCKMVADQSLNKLPISFSSSFFSHSEHTVFVANPHVVTHLNALGNDLPLSLSSVRSVNIFGLSYLIISAVASLSCCTKTISLTGFMKKVYLAF